MLFFRLSRSGQVGLILLLSLPTLAWAQCPTVGQLRDTLTQIAAQPAPNQEIQKSRLRQWRDDWKKCGYVQDSTYVDALLLVGLSLINQKNYPEASRLSAEVTALYRRPGPHLRRSDLAKAYYRQAVALYYLGEDEKEMAVLKKAIQVGRLLTRRKVMGFQRTPLFGVWVFCQR